MTDLVKLAAANNARWQAMKVHPQRVAQIDAVAHRLIAPTAKARYMALSARTGVPWPVIAVIHEREASQRWDRSIAQGDRIDRPSVNVPQGRGPFTSWENAGYDALVACAPYAAHWTDWSAGGALTILEQYNGLGYAAGPSDAETGKHYPPQPSPYIWADTDQYTSGKYIRDHVFKPDVVDPQDGCAALLARMIALDPSADFGGSKSPTPVVSDMRDTHWVQISLNKLGCKPPLNEDGDYGAKSRAAVRAFKLAMSLPDDDVLDDATLDALAQAIA